MNEPNPPVASQSRVVVVNLDQRWPFAQLVRRHALDIFANPRARNAVQFRTIGSETADNAEARRKIWGVRRPQFYGDDLDSLVADIGGDIDDLANDRITQLNLVFVAGDPARSAAAGQGRATDIVGALRRIEGLVFQAEGSAQTIRRYVCFRDETNGANLSHLLSRFTELCFDTTGQGRQLADKVFELRPLQLADRGEETHHGSFRLLRCALELIGDNSDAEHVAEGTSPARRLLSQDRTLLSLRPGGPAAPTTSARIAEMIRGYVDSAQAFARRNREESHSADGTFAKVGEVIGKIEGKIKDELRRWDSITDPIKHKASKVASLPTEFDALRGVRLWWRGGTQRSVEDKIKDLPRQIENALSDCLESFKSVRQSAETAIMDEIDPEIREAIARVPIVAGGVTGGVLQEVERSIEAIKKKCDHWRTEANQHRAAFMCAIKVREHLQTNSAAPAPSALEEIAIDRTDAGRKMRLLIPDVTAAYRGLIPMEYLVTMVMFGIGCLMTLGAHSLGKANGRTIWDGIYSSAALFVALGLALGAGFAVLLFLARRRRSHFISVVDELHAAHDEAWLRLETMLINGSKYVAISRQIFFFDLLLSEIQHRTGEVDRSALDLALADIAAPSVHATGNEPQIDNRLYQEMVADLSTRPVGRWIRKMLDSDTLFGYAAPESKTLSFDVDEAGSRARRRSAALKTANEMQTVTFLARQIVHAVPIEVPEPVLTRGTTA